MSDASAVRAVAGLVVRQTRRGALGATVTAAVMSAFVVQQFRVTFSRDFDPGSLLRLAANPAIRTLFGRPGDLSDAGGFTVWRTSTFVVLIVGMWGMLAATRATRGEEDAGRLGMLLAGRVTARQAAAATAAVLLGWQVLGGGLVAAGMILGGARGRPSLLYGAGVALLGAVLVGVGLLAAQLARERREAAGAAGVAVGACLLLRMLADGSESLSWLHWLTPFGLLAEVDPFASDRLLPLALLLVLAGALVSVVLLVVPRRDVGAGLVPPPAPHDARLWLLRTWTGLAVRQSGRAALVWSVALGLYLGLIGSLSGSVTEFLRDNPRFADLAKQAGFDRLGTVEGYAATMSTLLGVALGIMAAGRIAALASEERERRLVLPLSMPVGRRAWLARQAFVSAAVVVSVALVAALALVMGTRLAAGPALGVVDGIRASLAVLPVAALCMGVALLALGWWPSLTTLLGVLPAAGGYLLLVLAEAFAWPGWVRGLSPFDHLTAVPAVPPSWAGVTGLLVVAGLAGVAGVVGFARRDVEN